ncbi:MAG: cell surface protein [Rikenellaceae bacterium]|nr:cell surface protein [Rikenellaceae bacterium]
MFNLKRVNLVFILFAILFASCDKSDDVYEEDPIDGGEGYDSSKWISEIIEYRPAPGQFINTASGTQEAANSIIGGEGLVSLGGFGGYIIFRFDHTVLNQDGYDFAIKGNAFNGSSEPGIVMVSFDANGNGIADDEWYELAGENHEDAVKNYQITYRKPTQTDTAENIYWEDNAGGSGYINTENLESFHSQSFWPKFISGDPEELMFSGTLLENLVDAYENGSYYLAAAGKGYADNYSGDYTTVVNGDEDTGNSNKFDISDAIDGEGNRVKLEGVDFIKVYTAQNEQAGHLGESSTEIRGAISFSVSDK